jgi:hypothetical protein
MLWCNFHVSCTCVVYILVDTFYVHPYEQDLNLVKRVYVYMCVCVVLLERPRHRWEHDIKMDI